MQTCCLTITTKADGKENKVAYKGKMRLDPDSAQLFYRESQAEVCIKVNKETVHIQRQGDYTLSLALESGKTCRGSIGIGGSEGEVFTNTEYLAFSRTDTSLLLLLRYDLIVGGETQKMTIRIHAKA